MQSETQQQAIDQVSMSNTGSLRFLAAMDWREFVEAQSLVEQTFHEDPAGVYGQMDFATRDRYRHAVEKLAKSSPLSEGDVARQAGPARADRGRCRGTVPPHRPRRLLSHRQRTDAIEQAVSLRRSAFDRLRRWTGSSSVPIYLGSILFLTATFTGCFLALAIAAGWNGWLLALLGFVSALAASQLAVTLVNWIATALVTPSPLPRMDFPHAFPRRYERWL